MDLLSIETLTALFAVGLVAGFVDAIAGGGGLLTLPALLWAGLSPAEALATNKLQSSFGSFSAAVKFTRSGEVKPRDMAMMIACTFAGSAAGAIIVQMIDPGFLRNVIPVLLIGIAIWLLVSPKAGEIDAQQRIGERGFALLAGTGIGFYDGFFGPGAGAFYATIFLALGGLGLVRATAQTKAANLASNVAGLLTMIAGGHVIWIAGLAMAVGSIAGSQIGSRLAMRFGSKLIRPLLIIMSLGLTAKMLLDANNPIHQLLFG